MTDLEQDVRFRNTKAQDQNGQKYVVDLVVYDDVTDPEPHLAEAGDKSDLLYSISDIPPWYLCILLGLQHYLTAFGSTLSIPMILAPAFCLGRQDVAVAEILSTLIFVSGLVTVIQSTFGTRLPILQGGTFSFLAPTFAILGLPKWQCPEIPDNINSYAQMCRQVMVNQSIADLTNVTLNASMEEALDDFRTELWQSRVREIQGAIILASLFQVVIGASGIMGILLNFIGPLAIAPTIGLVGLALFEPAANACQGQWWIAIATIICITIFSQFLKNCDIPCYKVTKQPSGKRGCTKGTKFPFFGLFPMLLGICIMWLICYILTLTNTLPEKDGEWGHLARTDVKIEVLQKAKWFRFPYPFQWGMPTFSVAGTFGMLAGVIAGMLESLGDYYACARLSGAPPPPVHAINRGVLVEGIGCVLSGMWGSGNGSTSYSENIGSIGITRVGSRVVIQTAGLLMVVLGMLGKFGALFVTIPEPIIGGVFMVTFGMITAVGISNLQYVNLNSSRNLFIVGFAFFFGLSLPVWMGRNPNAIKTGSDIADQILTVLLSTSMFVGGVLGFILDNTVPGSTKERGIDAWRAHEPADAGDLGDDVTDDTLKCYDLPWCMGCVQRANCFRYIPFCPTFSFSPSCRCRRDRVTDSGADPVSTEIFVIDRNGQQQPAEHPPTPVQTRL